MATTALHPTDEGKQVVNADGQQVGVVTAVRNGTAYVAADPGLTRRVVSRLGWEDATDGDCPLRPSAIHRVTDEEVKLRYGI